MTSPRTVSNMHRLLWTTIKLVPVEAPEDSLRGAQCMLRPRRAGMTGAKTLYEWVSAPDGRVNSTWPHSSSLTGPRMRLSAPTGMARWQGHGANSGRIGGSAAPQGDLAVSR